MKCAPHFIEACETERPAVGVCGVYFLHVNVFVSYPFVVHLGLIISYLLQVSGIYKCCFSIRWC